MDNETLKMPNFVDLTVVCTPEPRACSTEGKQRKEFNFIKPVKPINFDSCNTRKSEDSTIGILTLSDIDMEPELEVPRKAAVVHNTFSESDQFNELKINESTIGPNSKSFNDASMKLKYQRELAQAVLNRVTKLNALPQRLINPSNSYWLKSPTNNTISIDSTVNESDLLKNSATSTILASKNSNPKVSLDKQYKLKSVCNPNVTSMPSSSPLEITTDYSLNKIASTKHLMSLPPTYSQLATADNTASQSKFQKDIEDLQEQCLNPDNSFRDIFEKLKQFAVHSTFIEENDSNPNNTDNKLDSGMFIPGELATEKFLAEELSWRKEYNDIPVDKRTSIVSVAPDTAYVSMGDFFKVKSDDCSLMFLQRSPPKHDPVPLIDVSQDLSELNETFLSEVNHHTSERKSVCSDKNDLTNITDDSRMGLTADKFSDSIAAIHNFIAGYKETPQKMVQKLINVMDSKHAKSSSNILKSSSNKSGASRKLYHNNTQFDNDRENRLNKYRVERPSLGDYGQHANKLQNSKQFVSSGHLPSANKADDGLEIRSVKSVKFSNSNRNKENAGDSHSDKTLTSVRSSSSMDIFPEGKLPIQCTKSELVWGCVKLGRMVAQDFTIRNSYSYKLRLQISCNNPNFKISKAEVDSVGTVTVILHPQEMRRFTLSFRPMSKGAHVGKLNFYPIIKSEIQKCKRQILMLYGYGGHACMDFSEVSKDSGSKIWLSFGHMGDNTELMRHFVVQNTGTLPAFAYFQAVSKTLASPTDMVKIEPNKIVLRPGDQSKILITYKLNKENRKHIKNYFLTNKHAFEFAYIKCTVGAEATRGRLRRISTKIIKDDMIDLDENLYDLQQPIEYEMIPDDVGMIRESIGATKELLHNLDSRELILNIDYIDETPSEISVSSFHTMFNNEMNVTVIENRPHITTVTATFTVEPSILILTPPNKFRDTILLTSESRVDMQFEVKFQPEGIINIDNRLGIVKPGQTLLLNIFCCKDQKKERQNVTIMIYAENDVCEVEVKVVHLRY